MKVHSLHHQSDVYATSGKFPNAISFVTSVSPVEVDGRIVNKTNKVPLSSVDTRKNFTCADFDMQKLLISGVFDSLKDVVPSSQTLLEESDLLESHFDKLSNLQTN